MTNLGIGHDPPAQAINALIEGLHQHRFADVVAQANVLIRTYQRSFVLWNILGAASAQNNQIDQAIMAFGKACALNPASREAHVNHGNALRSRGYLAAAATSYRSALSVDAGFADAHYQLGGVLCDQGEVDAAAAALRTALSLQPRFFSAAFDLATMLQTHGHPAEAAQWYRHTVTLDPGFMPAHYNLATVLLALGDLPGAAASYQQAIALAPGFDEAHFNLGTVYQAQGDMAAASGCYRQAIAINPRLSGAYTNLAMTLESMGKLDEAAQVLHDTLTIDPGNAAAEARYLFFKAVACDWKDCDILAAACNRLAQQSAAVAPFAFLALIDDPALQLEFSRKFAADKFSHTPRPALARPAARPDRLRIGYFSADLHDHATLYLIAGLLRNHDRARFEVVAYSYGRDTQDAWASRTRRDFDQFYDVANQPSDAIIELARSHALDIAIDLKGYTAHERLDLFKDRLAPIHISYLGYPGSLGSSAIDYIVADRVVIPPEQRQYYSENVIFLPHSYQPNDNERQIAETATTRADFGLPDHGLVFCCFNNTFKIGPREFDIWMRLLGKIDSSVLWLFKANPWCEDNLRQHAAARGVAPERLIFAERLDQAHHLARHKHADLFLDTFNCNAHTTSSDALWAGLPVVTRAGRQFAARVSASLLTAVGLPELITTTNAEYEALIHALAIDPDRIAHLKIKLALARHSHPLFNTAQYARDFEALLDLAYDHHSTGQAPQDIWLRRPSPVS